MISSLWQTKHYIERGNPLVITALSALYGYAPAQQVFDDDFSNASAIQSLTKAELNLINIFLLLDMVSAYSKQIWVASDIPVSLNFTLLTPGNAFNMYIHSLKISGIRVA